MATVIRLRRPGKSSKKRHKYRVVVCDDSVDSKGKFIDEIGQYNPTGKEIVFKIDKTKYTSWIKKGAKPSDTVKSLVKKTKS